MTGAPLPIPITEPIAGETPWRLSSLRTSFAWTVSGNVFYAACQWGMLVAIAKLGTAAMVGQYALGLAVCAPVFMLTGLQLRSVQATDAQTEYDLGHYMALRILGTVVALLAIGLLAWRAGYPRETTEVVVFVSLAKAADSLSDVFYGLWQKHERFDLVALALGGRGAGSVLTVTTVLWFTHRIVPAAAALAIYWGAWLLAYEAAMTRRMARVVGAQFEGWMEWEWGRLRPLAVTALPLGAVAFLSSLNTNLPRYALEKVQGESALGYFAAMAYLMVAGSIPIIALGQSALPRLARYFQGDRAAFVRLLSRMVVAAASVGAAGTVLCWLCGAQVLRWLYRPDYARYGNVLVWLAVGGGATFVAGTLNTALTSARKFLVQVPLNLVVIGVTAAVCWKLIPRFGLLGGAYAVFAGMAASCTGSLCVLAAALRSEAPRIGSATEAPAIVK
jgi:O-antigen/teichoic acid export membrane protein